MKHVALASIASLALIALAASCYQGKDDVPLMATSSTGAGGGDATGSASSGRGSTTTHGSSSSTSTASASGGGGASSGGGGGSAPDPCADTIFCDDFESYTAGSAPGGKWQPSQSGGTLAVDTGRAHSGSKAVKFSADASTGYRSIMIAVADASILPTANNVVYGRMMFYLESAPETSVHWTFIAGSGPVPSTDYDAIYRYGGQQPVTSGTTFVGTQLMSNYETPDSYDTPPVGPSTDCYQQAANKEVAPVGKWSCAEWQFDGGNDTLHFWLDGAALDDLTVDHTGDGCVNQPAGYEWLAPSFERIAVGWESYQADDARVFWVDDVALATHRIGCPQ